MEGIGAAYSLGDAFSGGGGLRRARQFGLLTEDCLQRLS